MPVFLFLANLCLVRDKFAQAWRYYRFAGTAFNQEINIQSRAQEINRIARVCLPHSCVIWHIGT